MKRTIRPENDLNNNDIPDDIDRAIIGYLVWQFVQAILLIIAVYSLFKLLGKL